MRKSQSVVLFLILVVLTRCDFQTDLQYIHVCNRTAPISLRTMNEVLINKKLTRTHTSANFPCFLHCLFTQYGWMDEEGGFELHTMRATLEESGSIEAPLLEYVMYTCTAVKSVDRCERALRFTECFWTRTAEENEAEDKFFYSLDEKQEQ